MNKLFRTNQLDKFRNKYFFISGHEMYSDIRIFINAVIKNILRIFRVDFWESCHPASNTVHIFTQPLGYPGRVYTGFK